MLKLLQRLNNFLFGDETPVPDEGKFLLIGGPAHLQIRYAYFTAEIIDDESGIYRREFIGFLDAPTYHQVYVYEHTTRGEAIDLLLNRRRNGEKG